MSAAEAARAGRRRVVITGLGAVTPLGNNLADTWAGMVAGRSGTGPLTRFDASHMLCQVAGELQDFNPEARLDKRLTRRTDPFIQYGLFAAHEAVEHAGLTINESNADRVGVVFGSGVGGLKAWHDNFRILERRGPDRVSPFLIPMLIGNMAAGMVSIELGARGPSKSIQTACATSAHSAGDALRLIQYGDADVVITGGSEAPITELAIAGFCAMKALTTRNNDAARASRPFDAERDGFIIAEGAAALVLEDYEHARRRGATMYAELVGYGQSSDAYHMAAPLPDGGGAARAIEMALDEGGLALDDIGYINAHATSTHAGDISEVNAIKRVFRHGYVPPVSASKSMTGHTLGAAGALELIVAVQALRYGILPPTINYETPDPECDLDVVPNEAREVHLDAAISNSFGFGGHNCCLAIRRV